MLSPNCVGKASLSECLTSGNWFIFRNKVTMDEGVWYLGLAHFPGSASACWSGTLKSIEGEPNLEYFVFDVLEELPLRAILDLGDDTVAVRLKWRSPLWQMRNVARYEALPLQVRLFKIGEIFPLRRILAQAAFFDLTLPIVTLYADCLELPLPQHVSGSLAKSLFYLVQAIEKCSDEDAATIISQRFAFGDAQEPYLIRCLEMDECLEVMDEQDVKKSTGTKRIAKPH